MSPTDDQLTLSILIIDCSITGPALTIFPLLPSTKDTTTATAAAPSETKTKHHHPRARPGRPSPTAKSKTFARRRRDAPAKTVPRDDTLMRPGPQCTTGEVGVQ